MKIILETQRLLLREFTIGDTDFVISLLNSPGWIQFIGDKHIRTKQDAETYLINGPLKSYKANGFGLSMVMLKATNEPIGMCGLIKREILAGVDIGFAFLPQHTGNGFAFEIASATIHYAKNVLKLSSVLAITTPDNVRSISLLEKMGFKFEKIILLAGEELMLFKNEVANN